MAYEAKNFDYLLGKLNGLSDKQLTAHFGLYKGYVNKLNEIEEKLKTANPQASNYSFGEFSELKRREAVAFNGSFLHELYFENLSNEGGEVSEELKFAIEKSFGSWDKWLADTKASAISTHGWVVLTFNRKDNTLHNYIMYEHHIGLPVHQEIILALDCWEHAYMIDYGTTKAEYLNTFLNNLNWNVVNKRFLNAFGGKWALE